MKKRIMAAFLSLCMLSTHVLPALAAENGAPSAPSSAVIQEEADDPADASDSADSSSLYEDVEISDSISDTDNNAPSEDQPDAAEVPDSRVDDDAPKVSSDDTDDDFFLDHEENEDDHDAADGVDADSFIDTDEIDAGAVWKSAPADEEEGNAETVRDDAAVDAEAAVEAGAEFEEIPEPEEWADPALGGEFNEESHYSIDFEDVYPDWVYSDGSLTVGLDIDITDGTEYALAPTVGVWDSKNEEFSVEFNNPAEDGWSLREGDNPSITLDGEKLFAKLREYDSDRVEVRIGVMVNEDGEWSEMASVQRGFDVWEAVYDYDFGIDDRSLLPGWDHWIDKSRNCRIENTEYPDGTDKEFTITNVKAEDAEGKNVVAVEYQDEDSWQLRAKNMGRSIITLTYTDAIDPGQTHEQTFNFYVGGEVYNLGIWTEDGSDKTLPGKTVNLFTEASCEMFDPETGNYSYASAEDLEGSITYLWQLEEVPDDAAGLVTLSVDEDNPRQASVTFSDGLADWDELHVRVLVSIRDGEGNELEQTDYWLHMMRHYYELWPTGIKSDMEVGEVITFRPEIREYPADNEDGCRILSKDDVQFEEEIYDEEAYTLDKGEDEDGVVYTLKRLRNYGTSFRIKAHVRDDDGNFYEVDNREYWLNNINYDFRFADMDNNTIYGDGSRTFGFEYDFDTDSTGFELTADVGNGEWTEENGFEETVGADTGAWEILEDKSGIRFNGEKLRELDLYHIEVRVSLRMDSIEVSDTWCGFEVRDPNYDFHGFFDDQILFVDDEWHLDKSSSAYVESAWNPQGDELPYTITNLKIEQEEDNYDPRDAFTVEEDDNGWTLRAVRGGYADLAATIVFDNGGDPVPCERAFRLVVGGGRANIGLQTSTGSDRLRSGGSVQLIPQSNYERYDWDTGERYNVDTSDYPVRYEVYCEWLDDNFVENVYGGDYDKARSQGETWDYSVDEATNVLTLTSKREDVPWMDLCVKAYLLDPESEEEIASTDRWIFVNQEYYEIALVDGDGRDIEWDKDMVPGADVTFTPQIRKYAGTDDSFEVIENAAFHFGWYEGNPDDEYDPSHIEITDADGRKLASDWDQATGTAPFTVRRVVYWDFNFDIDASWIDEEGNSQGLNRELDCDWTTYSDGFIKNIDRGYSRYIWYYPTETVDVRPDRERLDALRAEGYDVQTTVQIGRYDYDTEKIVPIIKYEIDEDGRRGASQGEYDLSGIFSEKNGLQVSGQALEDLRKMLGYQEDENGHGDPLINILFTSTLNGVPLFEGNAGIGINLISVRLYDAYAEIADIPWTIPIGDTFVWENGQSKLYVQDPEHDRGVDDENSIGTTYDVTITKIELKDPDDSGYMEVVHDGADWGLKAKGLPGDVAYTHIPVVFTVDGADGFTTIEEYIEISVGTYETSVKDADGKDVTSLDLLLGESVELVSSVTYRSNVDDPWDDYSLDRVEYYIDDERILSAEEIDSAGENDSAGKNEKRAVIRANNTGSTKLWVELYIKEGDSVLRPVEYVIPVNISTAKAKIDIRDDLRIYVTPGQILDLDDFSHVFPDEINYVSTRNPEGGTVEVGDYLLDRSLNNIEGVTALDGKRLQFNEDILEGFTGDNGTFNLDIPVVAISNDDELSAVDTIRVIVHTHEIETITTPATLEKDGSIVEHCTVCGEDLTSTAVSRPAKFKLSATAYTYNGSAKKPAVTVTDAAGKVIPAKSGDGTVNYTVAYSNNKNAGTASSAKKPAVKITFKGSYSGTKTLYFTINKAANSITGVSSSYTRSYSAKAQTIQLKPAKKAGTIKYSSNKSAVKVTSAGKITIGAKFTGTATITMKIAATANYKAVTKKITVVVPAKTTLSSVTNSASKKMTVKWKKNTAVTGYQIQYSLKSNFASGNKTVTVSRNSTVSKVIGSLKKGKKYYVRIRSYKTAGGKKYYSAWSASKAVTIKK